MLTRRGWWWFDKGHMEYDVVQYGSVQFRAAAERSWSESQPRRQDLPSTWIIWNGADVVLSLCLFSPLWSHQYRLCSFVLPIFSAEETLLNFVWCIQSAAVLLHKTTDSLPLFYRTRIFKLLRGPENRFQVINSAGICSLTGRYDNPFPTRFLSHIKWLNIPALYCGYCDIT